MTALEKEVTKGLTPKAMVACSKRSDSGERCGVEKAMKSRGGLPRFYFFALPFTLHRSPLSERLEQAKAMEADLKLLFRLQKFPSVRSPSLSTKPSPETP